MRHNFIGYLNYFLVDYLMTQNRFWILLKKHFVHSHVHCWNNFLRIAYQLTIQIFIKRLQCVPTKPNLEISSYIK